ncbi:nucleoside-diphosphate kinase [Candidatus Gracilibacteria bacterium]|nr:nucleoside-diphosphate kinase [Candidatus Gracilibacteria bacterium]MCF7819786.1 nucleoside-diphosphate kinase [Candidatus Gracilibacteria bacterium]
MEQSLVIIKPDAIQRGLVGNILQRFEYKGLKIVGLKMIRLDEALLKEHYAHVAEKPFFQELSQFMSSSPVLVLVLEGPQAVELVRLVCGISPTDMGSIRGDFSLSTQRNVVHSSDTPENAQKEIRRFFSEKELFEYDKDEWRHALSLNER